VVDKMFKSYAVECFFVGLAVVIAKMLSSDQLLINVNYDYSFIVFFSCLFSLFIPVWYLAAKKF